MKEGDGSTWDFKVSGDFMSHNFKVKRPKLHVFFVDVHYCT